MILGGWWAVSYLGALRGANQTPAPSAAAPATLEPNAVETGRTVAVRIEQGLVGRGGTLASALDRLGLAEPLARELLATADRHLDLRRLPASTGIAVVYEDDRPARVTIRDEPTRFVRIVLDPANPPAASSSESLRLPVQIAVETVGGVVESSVAQALSGAADGHRLTLEFADVFQWDVDLLVDPRPGDELRIVYEAQRLGEAPEDLPRFGNAAYRTGDRMESGRILAATYDGEMASASAFWVFDQGESGSYYDDEGQPMRKSFLKSPLNYRRISSRFSRARRNPVTRKVVPHHGVDFAAAPGTPVVATADGTVVSAGWNGALGRAVTLRHGGEYVTIYGHLRGTARGIRRGAQVRQNQVIGYVGSSGRATGPHLHYTVQRFGRPIDPMRMENPPAEPLDPALHPWLAETRRRWLRSLTSINPPALQALRAAGETPARSGG